MFLCSRSNSAKTLLSFESVVAPPRGETLQRVLALTYICDWPWFVDSVAHCAGSVDVVINWLPETCDTEMALGQRWQTGTQPVTIGSRTVDVTHADLGTNGRALMHCKALFLQFDTVVRVCISSSNLTLADWVGLVQVGYVRDFPRTSAPRSCELSASISDMLTCVGAPPAAMVWALNADHTGAHESLLFSSPIRSPSQKYGLARLAELVARRPSSCQYAKSPVVYQASAVGGMEGPILKKLLTACGITDGDASKFAVLFPSQRTVETMLDYTVGCITTRYFQNHNSVLSERVYDTGPTCEALHSKVIYHVCDGDPECHWLYMGSHNLTRDCWANLNFEAGMFMSGRAVAECVASLPFATRGLNNKCEEPFRFIPSKPLIRSAGERLIGGVGVDRSALHYHWYQFLAEYGNNFGRH